jgi:hypothetical protein
MTTTFWILFILGSAAVVLLVSSVLRVRYSVLQERLGSIGVAFEGGLLKQRFSGQVCGVAVSGEIRYSLWRDGFVLRMRAGAGAQQEPGDEGWKQDDHLVDATPRWADIGARDVRLRRFGQPAQVVELVMAAVQQLQEDSDRNNSGNNSDRE